MFKAKNRKLFLLEAPDLLASRVTEPLQKRNEHSKTSFSDVLQGRQRSARGRKCSRCPQTLHPHASLFLLKLARASELVHAVRDSRWMANQYRIDATMPILH